MYFLAIYYIFYVYLQGGPGGYATPCSSETRAPQADCARLSWSQPPAWEHTSIKRVRAADPLRAFSHKAKHTPQRGPNVVARGEDQMVQGREVGTLSYTSTSTMDHRDSVTLFFT